MQLPHERGPISRHVIESLTSDVEPSVALALGTDEVISDGDAQLALWMIYELHYRGFDGVPADREWDTGLLALRRDLERRFELELRAGTRDRLGVCLGDWPRRFAARAVGDRVGVPDNRAGRGVRVRRDVFRDRGSGGVGVRHGNAGQDAEELTEATAI